MAARERVYRTEAVVLRRGDLGEADRLLTVYSPTYGKLRLVAKGARRPTSRKAGHLEPLTRVELLLAKGRGGDHPGHIRLEDFKGSWLILFSHNRRTSPPSVPRSSWPSLRSPPI